MRQRSVLAAAGAAVAATLALGGAPVSAQAPPEPQPISVDPASAAAGTTVTISGEGCVSDGDNGVMIDFEYLGEDGQRSFRLPQGADGDGTWTAPYLVRDTDPIGTYELRATCVETTSEPISVTPLFDYPVATFEVTDGTTPTEPVDPTVPSVLSLAIDPTSGPVGTTINVSGDDCTGDLVWFGLFSGSSEADGAIVDLWWANPGADGTWSDELLVYEAMVPFTELDKAEPAVVPVEPGGDYYVGAWCEYYPDELGDIDEPGDGSGPAPDEIVFSDTIAFEVTAAGVAPRTDPLPVNPVAVDVRPQAQPAIAVVADPTYTG